MKLIIIGLDGATFDLIKPWAAEGKLPTLARLMQDGTHGYLESTLPPVTSPAWPTFMTGKNPGKHGVFDFIRPRAGSFDMVNASQIHGKLLWEILSEAGYSVGVLNVPITYPPRPVNGYLVPGLLSPDQGKTVYPIDFRKPYEAELGKYRLTPNVQYKPGNEAEFIADIHDLIDTQLRYALRLMTDRPTDVLMLHFLASDNGSHALWRFMDKSHPRYDAALAGKYGDALQNLYQHLDQAVAAVIDQAHSTAAGGQPSGLNTIVMSDHGFGPLHRTINLNILFLEKGLMFLKPKLSTRLRYWAFRHGLTPAGVYKILSKLGLQNITARVSRKARNEVVGKFLSFEDVDWSRTVAYSMGHVGQIYINLKGREPFGRVEPDRYLEARQQVITALNTLIDPDTGKSLVDRIIPREEAAHGPYLDQGADLHLILDDYKTIAFPLFATEGRVLTPQIRGDSGCHRLYGIFIGSGAAFEKGAEVSSARIIDLAPTILHILNTPIPADMDGRVLIDALTPELRSRASQVGAAADGIPNQVDLSDVEQAEVEERLRALGYLG
ncbi:MAG TPA: alkaline phosphatase family protein [Anaerolineae bacterium]|nr:alkaline phosphatase family protein [Anaerolineae bacterium]